MCNFMSLRVVNLDNRPFYTVVKQIIKKSRSRGGGWRVDGFRGIFIFTNTSVSCAPARCVSSGGKAEKLCGNPGYT